MGVFGSQIPLVQCGFGPQAGLGQSQTCYRRGSANRLILQEGEKRDLVETRRMLVEWWFSLRMIWGFLGPGNPDLVTELCPPQDTA